MNYWNISSDPEPIELFHCLSLLWLYITRNFIQKHSPSLKKAETQLKWIQYRSEELLLSIKTWHVQFILHYKKIYCIFIYLLPVFNELRE